MSVLNARLAHAFSRKERAEAHFQLALFHDNNSREAQAIPHYRRALRLGLAGESKAQALVWLASSLHKTGKSKAAFRYLDLAFRLTDDAALLKFLEGLRGRIARTLNEKRA